MTDTSLLFSAMCDPCDFSIVFLPADHMPSLNGRNRHRTGTVLDRTPQKINCRPSSVCYISVDTYH